MYVLLIGSFAGEMMKINKVVRQLILSLLVVCFGIALYLNYQDTASAGVLWSALAGFVLSVLILTLGKNNRKNQNQVL